MKTFLSMYVFHMIFALKYKLCNEHAFMIHDSLIDDDVRFDVSIDIIYNLYVENYMVDLDKATINIVKPLWIWNLL